MCERVASSWLFLPSDKIICVLSRQSLYFTLFLPGCMLKRNSSDISDIPAALSMTLAYNFIPLTLFYSENKLTSASVMADVIMEMVIQQLENSASKLVSVNELAECFVPHHCCVHTVSDEFRLAEKFNKTLCSHGTVQYFRFVQTKIWAARRLNFRAVKVGPSESRRIRPMPCDRNPREDISSCITITKLRFFKLLLCSFSFADEYVSCSETVNVVPQV